MDKTVLAAIITAIVGPVSVVAIQELVRYFRNRKGSKLDIIQEEINNLKADIIEVRKNTLKLQFLNFLRHEPENTDAISKIYDEYRKLNGNSYIIGLYEAWKEKYLKQKRPSSRKRSK